LGEEKQKKKKKTLEKVHMDENMNQIKQGVCHIVALPFTLKKIPS
jgi:hypothetical protein